VPTIIIEGLAEGG